MPMELPARLVVEEARVPVDDMVEVERMAVAEFGRAPNPAIPSPFFSANS